MSKGRPKKLLNASKKTYTKEEIEAKMNCTDNMSNDVGTLLFGPETVEMGLMDEIGSLASALKKLRSMIK